MPNTIQLPLRPRQPVLFDGWGAHAGLGRRNPGGTPSADDLRRALGLGLAYIEIDVLVTKDGELVLRHDPSVLTRQPRPQPTRKLHLPHRKDRLVAIPVSKLTLAQLRAHVPHTMTLDEAVALIGKSVPVLLDLNTDPSAEALGAWLARNSGRGTFSVCSKSLTALAAVRSRAPAVPRQMTLPDMPREMRHPAWDVVRSFARDADPRDLPSALAALARALADGHPRLRMSPFRGITWRPYLREGLKRVVDETGATGLCVHQWLVTRELVEAAHDLGLPVTAWTVNDDRAMRRVIASGADFITSDQPDRLRESLSRSGLRGLFGGLRRGRDREVA